MPSQFSCVELFVTLWMVGHQTPLSMKFSRQKYWSKFPSPPPGGSFWPKDETCVSCFLHWQVGSLPLVSPEKLLDCEAILYKENQIHWWSLNGMEGRWSSMVDSMFKSVVLVMFHGIYFVKQGKLKEKKKVVSHRWQETPNICRPLDSWVKKSPWRRK